MSDEVLRARAIAVGALALGFLLFVLAIATAVTGGGDDNGGSGETVATATTKKRPAKRPPRPRPPAPAGFKPVPANAPGAHKAPNEAVPVLAYNVINAPRSDTGNPEIWVPTEEFTAQMRYLADQGYHGVTLRQVWAAWKEGGLLPSKPIVISFDTGYPSVHENALPVLRERGWPGTLFLQASQTEGDFAADEIKALVDAGWELDATAQTGATLTGVTDEQLDAEVAGGRRRVQQEFRVKAEFFAYPGGDFDSRTTQAVEAAGFLGAVTLTEGLASPDDPPFELKRIPVVNGDGEEGLAQKLDAAQEGSA
jgi:peptidoglycan/xylan/chitin deacetylase (PgdA/CDA1 family)